VRFKPNGIKIMESFEGDLLFYDSKLKTDIIFNADLLMNIKSDPIKSTKFVDLLMSFLERHYLLRWEHVKKQLIEIAEKYPDGIAFVKDKKPLIVTATLRTLKQLETDIYFFEQQHGNNKIDFNKQQ